MLVVSENGPGAGEKLRIKFWGTRGSIATPGPRTTRYGGNTSCTEVRYGEHIIILDAGTGLREMGISLLTEFGKKPIRAHIFVGHTHWDHIQGFPFFTPAYMPGNEFTLYSMRETGKPLERVFRGQMDDAYFPVQISDMQSRLHFVELQDAVKIGPITVKFHYLNHPGNAIGFRIDVDGKSVVYTSDHEAFNRTIPGEAGEVEESWVFAFAQGADYWIREAQYTEEEYSLKKGWGHSTFNDALYGAAVAGVQRLCVFHHDPTHDDDFMDRQVEEMRAKVAEQGWTFECEAAQEGAVIEI